MPATLARQDGGRSHPGMMIVVDGFNECARSKMNDGLTKRVQVLERSFMSPFSIDEMFEIAKGLGELHWFAAESYYYGDHFHGTAKDGASIQIFDYTSSEAVYTDPKNRSKTMDQLEAEYGIGVEISIPKELPDADAERFLDFIERKLFLAIKAEPMERFTPFGR